MQISPEGREKNQNTQDSTRIPPFGTYDGYLKATSSSRLYLMTKTVCLHFPGSVKQVVWKKKKAKCNSSPHPIIKENGRVREWEGSGEEAFPSQHKKNVHFCLGE